MKQQQFDSPDYYAIDDLLSEEQKLIRQSVREFIPGTRVIQSIPVACQGGVARHYLQASHVQVTQRQECR